MALQTDSIQANSVQTQSDLTADLLNVGQATQAVAQGDVAAADASNSIFFDASSRQCLISGGSASYRGSNAVTFVGGTGAACFYTTANASGSGTGGQCLLGAGNGGASNGIGGAVVVVAGDAGGGNAAGGVASVTSGDGAGTGAGGNATITAGNGGGSGNGADVIITAGAGGGTAGAAGDVDLFGGTSSNGPGGSISLLSGTGSTLSGDVSIQTNDGGSGNAGQIVVQTGTGGTNANGGQLTLQTGPGGATNGDSGGVSIDVGVPNGAGSAGPIDIGTTNADAITVGNSTSTTDLVGTVRALKTTAAHASGATLVAADLRGQVHTNSGAGAGSTTINLPSVSDGLHAHFVQVDSGNLTVNPDNADNFLYSGGAMAAGEALILQSAVSVLHLVSDGNTRWLVLEESGTIVEETP